MARKQMTIPGTGRAHHEDVETAIAAYIETRDERMVLTKRERQKKLEALAIMSLHKLKKYKFDNQDGEELLVEIDAEPTLHVRKTGESEEQIGEGLPEHPESSTTGVHNGLIAQAMKAQEDSGVEETSDGDIIPISGDGKRKPRKKKAKG